MRPTITWLALVVSAAHALSAAPPADRAAMPPLHGEAIAWDAARSRAVLFGGRAGDDWLRGTWEWDGHAWRRAAAEEGGPAPRAGHALGFDPDRRQTILFGGMHASPVTLLCDTWAFDGTRWTRLADGACWTDRVRNASLVPDEARRRMLLVEGPAVAADEPRPLRLWTWTGTAWTLVDDRGPRRTGFSAVAWDAARHVLVVPVLFGGPDEGTWEWDGTAWRRASAEGPSTRQTYALAFDPRSGRVVLKGGQGSARGPYLADAWSWDGARWREESALSAEGPAGRGGATLLADASARRLLYFGGYAEALLGDFWSFDHRGWMRLTHGPPERP